MRWLTNIDDPNRPHAERFIVVDTLFGQTPETAVAYQREWLADKIIGEPKASEVYTVEQLKAMGMVGVYAKEEGEAAA